VTGSSDKVKGKMLKLLKNDFLASARVIPLFYLVEIVALAVFYFGKYAHKQKYLLLGGGIGWVVSVLLIFVTFFFVVYDYQKSLFGQQGYLSFTLPVNSHQLLGSKLIIYGLWMVVSFADFILVTDLITRYVQGEYGDTIDSASAMLSLFANFPSKAQIITYAIYFIAYFFGTVLSFTIMVYFSIALSHIRQFQKAHIIWSILIFIGTFIIFTAGISLFEKYFGIYIVLGADKSMKINFGNITSKGTPLELIPFVYMVIQDIVYFFLTSHIMHKRINIS
jgi:hypothetical protein